MCKGNFMTLSSVLNTVLFSGITIVILGYVLRNSEVMMKLGIHTVIVFVALTLFRLLIPFDLPTHTNLNITKIWPDIYILFVKPLFVWRGYEWSLLSFLIILSAAGSLFSLGFLVCCYFILRDKIKNYRVVQDDEIIDVAECIKYEYQKIHNDKRPRRFELVYGSNSSSPVVFGLIKHYIVIPDIQLKRQEWYYILKHEMAHCYFGDLWLRVICEAVTALYWWNPFIYMLRKQITRLQEFRVDFAVIRKLDELQKLGYLECLINIAKYKKRDRTPIWEAAFTEDSDREVIKRACLILNKNKEDKPNRFKSLLVGGLLVVNILLFPNLIIIEPYAIAKEHIEDTYRIDKTNSYYILQEDGIYDVYVDGQYFGSVTSIFDDSLTIYSEDGEEIK